MARKDIEAGRAHVVIGLRNNVTRALRSVQAGLQTFARTAQRLGSNLQRVGLFITGPLLAAGLASEKVRDKLSEARDVLSKSLEPVLLPLVESFGQIVKRVSAWIGRNQQLMRTIIKVGAGLLLAGVLLKVAAAAASVLATALGVAASILAIKILGPLILIGGILAVMVAAWVAFTESGRKAFAAVMKWAEPLINIGKQISGGIFDALMGGEIKLAWEIVLKTMEIAWHGFVSRMVGALAPLSDSMATLSEEAGAAAIAGSIELAGLLAKAKALRAGGGGDVAAGGGIGKSLVAGSTAAAIGLGMGSKPDRMIDEIRKLADPLKKAESHLREMRIRNARAEGVFGA